MTTRQQSSQQKFCSRACHGKNFSLWHTKPENKALMREHGARTAMQGQRGPTDIECIMADALDAIGVVYAYQFPISNHHGIIFSCDFALPSARIVIECDGSYWHALPNMMKRDKHKDAYLKAAGYTLLRFSDKQIKQDIEGCIQTILSHL